MGEAVQTIQAANNGIEGLLALIENARSLAQSALSADTTTDADKLEKQYNEILGQIDTMAKDSGYKGINLLESSTKAITVKFDETGVESKITITGFDGSSSGLKISATSGQPWQADSVIGTANIETDIKELDGARTTLRSQAKALASNLSVITTRQDFTSKMINTLNDGAANLTLADMNEEGANMLMLQTRQALATTSLSLASQAAQSVLKLF
jgi:flagellin-like hook-associated protein FlgL